MSIYIYCIINSNKIPENLLLKGIEDSSIFCLPYKEIGAVFCNIQDNISDLKLAIINHEQTIESLMEFFTVLPMRFQTILKNEEDVINKLEKYYDNFKNNLTNLSGKLEYGLKVIWPADQIKAIMKEDCNNIKNSQLNGSSSAVKYLREKYKTYKLETLFKQKADMYVNKIDNYFARITSEKKLRKLQTEKLLLNAAYLIEKKHEKQILKIFKQLKQDLKELEFLFSGPWPAYNFIINSKENNNG